LPNTRRAFSVWPNVYSTCLKGGACKKHRDSPFLPGFVPPHRNFDMETLLHRTTANVLWFI
jgi:hypothetical protein